MGQDSKIEWTHHTFNSWRGCTKVSQGCKNCYAEQMSGRNPAVLGIWGKLGSRPVAAESYWQQPLRWNREAAAAGERRRVFCSSLADVFEGRETMPESAVAAVWAARFRLFHLIEATPHLDWLLLTKRPENVLTLAPERWEGGWPANVWIGTSVEDQAAADARIPHLLHIPSRVRFLSCEPLLGAVDLYKCIEEGDVYGDGAVYWNMLSGEVWMRDGFEKDCSPEPPIHWVIVGGESGSNARPMHPAWARSLRDQCEAAGVPFFYEANGWCSRQTR